MPNSWTDPQTAPHSLRMSRCCHTIDGHEHLAQAPSSSSLPSQSLTWLFTLPRLASSSSRLLLSLLLLPCVVREREQLGSRKVTLCPSGNPGCPKIKGTRPKPGPYSGRYPVRRLTHPIQRKAQFEPSFLDRACISGPRRLRPTSSVALTITYPSSLPRTAQTSFKVILE